MERNLSLLPRAALLAGAALALAELASAQERRDEWRFRGALYGYLPHIGGSTSFPAGNGGQIDVDPSDLIENLEFAAMGSFSATRGRWGVFTDVIYLDERDSVNDSTSIGAGGMPLPPGITADAALEVRAWAWTLAGSYTAVATPADTLDVFAGARLLHVRADLDYEFSAEFGPFVGPARSGTLDESSENLDAIVGFKGRHRLGASAWTVPYYADVGTGESDLTWQAAAGLGYETRWGELFAAWRFLDYEFDSGSAVEDLEFSGPAVGFAIRW